MFANEALDAQDFEIFYLKPIDRSKRPRIPAKRPEDAVLVRCRFGHRTGNSTEAAVNMISDVEVRGEFNITVRLDWSPTGSRHFIKLVSQRFFDGTCLFRAVKDFLVQFGVSHDSTARANFAQTIRDDPPRPDLLPLRRGTLAYAGTGVNSRTTQLWIALKDEVAGKEPWETPVGYIQSKDGLEALDGISTEYGDLPAFDGNAPDPALMEKEDGPSYLLKGWPNIDYLESCTVVGNARDERISMLKPEEVFIGTVKAGEQLTQHTMTGHRFVAKVKGSDKVHKMAFIKKTDEFVQLSSSATEL